MPYGESPIGVKWRMRVSRANSTSAAFAKQLVIARYQEGGRAEDSDRAREATLTAPSVLHRSRRRFRLQWSRVQT